MKGALMTLAVKRRPRSEPSNTGTATSVVYLGLGTDIETPIEHNAYDYSYQ